MSISNYVLNAKIADMRKQPTLKALTRCSQNDLIAVHNAYISIAEIVRGTYDLHYVLGKLGYSFNTIEELSITLFAIQSQLELTLRGIDIRDIY